MKINKRGITFNIVMLRGTIFAVKNKNVSFCKLNGINICNERNKYKINNKFPVLAFIFLSFIYLLQITVVKSHNNRLWMADVQN